jgi:hypothetical protein
MQQLKCRAGTARSRHHCCCHSSRSQCRPHGAGVRQGCRLPAAAEIPHPRALSKARSRHHSVKHLPCNMKDAFLNSMAAMHHFTEKGRTNMVENCIRPATSTFCASHGEPVRNCRKRMQSASL